MIFANFRDYTVINVKQLSTFVFWEFYLNYC